MLDYGKGTRMREDLISCYRLQEYERMTDHIDVLKGSIGMRAGIVYTRVPT